MRWKYNWILPVFPAIILAQTSRTVLDGVFTDAQASRGEGVYSTRCAECHEGADVDGPALEGTPFIDRWREDSLATLFGHIKTRMPADNPGNLAETEYLDILAYLLKTNGYTSGERELTAESVGTTILVDKTGPRPLPSTALVEAVGCLTPDAGAVWLLQRAGPLKRTQTGDQINEEEKTSAAGRPPGSGSIRLQRLSEIPGFAAESSTGHRILVKGVLVRQQNVEHINVTVAQVIAPGCGP